MAKPGAEVYQNYTKILKDDATTLRSVFSTGNTAPSLCICDCLSENQPTHTFNFTKLMIHKNVQVCHTEL